MTQETTKIQEAIQNFGADVVEYVQMVVEFADPDGAYTTFEDRDMYDHAECVSFLYFED